MKLVALFFCKLSKDSPAPGITYAIQFDKAATGTQTKRNYLTAIEGMKADLRAYKYFKRLAVVQDMTTALIAEAGQLDSIIEVDVEEI